MNNVKVCLMDILKGETKEKVPYYKATLYCKVGNQSFVQDLFIDKDIADKYSAYLNQDITKYIALKYNIKKECIEFTLP